MLQILVLSLAYGTLLLNHTCYCCYLAVDCQYFLLEDVSEHTAGMVEMQDHNGPAML